MGKIEQERIVSKECLHAVRIEYPFISASLSPPASPLYLNLLTLLQHTR